MKKSVPMHANAKITHLKHKKKQSQKKRVLVYSVLSFLALVLVVLFFNIQFFFVKNIYVTGAVSLDSLDVKNFVVESLNKKIGYVLPRKNIFLVNKKTLSLELKKEYSLIEEVQIKKTFSGIFVSLIERKPEMLWCSKIDVSTCYFVNKDGVIFEKAGTSSNPLFFVFFTTFKNMGNPLNQSILNKESFERIKNIKESLKSYHVPIYGHMAVSDTEEILYIRPLHITNEISVVSLPHLKILPTQTAELVVSKLVTALKSKKLQQAKKDDFITVEYIDLRFNDQVSFKLK